MSSLFRVELSRLRWRRAILLLLTAVIAVPVVFAVAIGFETQPPSEADRAAAVRQAEEEASQPYVEEELELCQDNPQDYGVGDAPDLQAACEEMVVPRPEWFLYTQELDLVQQRDDTGLAVVVFVSVLLLLAGATFVGHDWNSGSMSNQLLFEPRRLRVWTAKALAVFLVSTVLSLVVLTGYWLALWWLARSRDLPASTEILLDCLQDGARGALVAGFAAFGGYALTMLFRSTVATIGVLFAVAVAGGALIGVLGIDARYQPQTNFNAVILDGATYYVEVPEECHLQAQPPEGVDCDDQRVLPALEGGIYLGALVLLAGAASVLSFRRRDVP
jgi:ABC-2 type transport system permease protein